MSNKTIVKILCSSLILIFGIFITLSVLFNSSVKIDEAKLLEEFAKSLVSIALLSLTFLYDYLKEKYSIVRKLLGLQKIVIQSMVAHEGLLRNIINFPPIYFSRTPPKLLLSNAAKKKEFKNLLNQLKIIISEQKHIITNNEIEVSAHLSEYLLLQEILISAIDNYLTNPNDNFMKNVQTQSSHLIDFLAKEGKKIDVPLVNNEV